MDLKLSQNKVLAGHKRNMRDTKYLMKKSNANMYSIFGVREDAYSFDPPPPLSLCVDPKRRTTPSNAKDNGGTVAKRKNRRRDRNRGDNDGSVKNNKRVN